MVIELKVLARRTFIILKSVFYREKLFLDIAEKQIIVVDDHTSFVICLFSSSRGNNLKD